MSRPAAIALSLLLTLLPAAANANDCTESVTADASLSGSKLDAVAGYEDRCDAGPDSAPGQGRAYPFTVMVVVDAPITFDGCATGEVLAAVEYRDIRFATDEGIVLYNDFECVPYSALDPAPVDPPTGGDVWDVVREQLPMPTVRLSPGAKGLVGIETWFWADPQGDGLQPVDHDGDPSTAPRWGLTLTADVGSIATTATVWIDEYRWIVDEGVVLAAPRPGSEPDPAAVHTYRRKGPRELVASTVWRGTWDSPLGGGTLGPAELAGAPLPYRVHEVRSVPADG